MPPIKVFTNSPINASKPSGTTPETAQESQQNNAPPPTTTSSQQQGGYPAPQPAAAPSLPQPTSSYNTTAYQPTPTRVLSSDGSTDSPPPPQPGAIPVPPGGVAAATHLPPPPKAGEKLPSQQPSITTMPPQMSYSLPNTNAPPHYLGSSTSTAPPSQTQGYPGGPSRPATLMEGGGLGGSGYAQQQNMGSYQQRSYDNDGSYDNQDESVWGTAKKWAYAAGDSLAKAENEVWKRINKE